MGDLFHALLWRVATMLACIGFGLFLGAHLSNHESGQEWLISITIIVLAFLLVLFTAYSSIMS